jgi:hypothetical protein
MVTANAFRRIALSMQSTIEAAHMGHPDFRTNGRIFATLDAQGEWGMVKLTPEQQDQFVRARGATFIPAAGAWGRGGSTKVRLSSVDETTLGEAMTLAWQNAVRQPVPRPRAPRAPRASGSATKMKASASNASAKQASKMAPQRPAARRKRAPKR